MYNTIAYNALKSPHDYHFSCIFAALGHRRDMFMNAEKPECELQWKRDQRGVLYEYAGVNNSLRRKFSSLGGYRGVQGFILAQLV
jgi:hypothetical protein